MSEKKDSSSLTDKLLERMSNSFPGGSDDWRVNTLLYVRAAVVFGVGPIVHDTLTTTSLHDVAAFTITTLSIIGLLRVTSGIARLAIAVIDRINRPRPVPHSDIN